MSQAFLCCIPLSLPVLQLLARNYPSLVLSV